MQDLLLSVETKIDRSGLSLCSIFLSHYNILLCVLTAVIFPRHVEGKKLDRTVWSLLTFHAYVSYHVKVRFLVNSLHLVFSLPSLHCGIRYSAMQLRCLYDVHCLSFGLHILYKVLSFNYKVCCYMCFTYLIFIIVRIFLSSARRDSCTLG